MKNNASDYNLEELVGRHVKALREFAGIAKGTVGMVIEFYVDSPRHHGITVEWNTTEGIKVRDGFGRDTRFDETKWLEVVD